MNPLGWSFVVTAPNPDLANVQLPIFKLGYGSFVLDLFVFGVVLWVDGIVPLTFSVQEAPLRLIAPRVWHQVHTPNFRDEYGRAPNYGHEKAVRMMEALVTRRLIDVTGVRADDPIVRTRMMRISRDMGGIRGRWIRRFCCVDQHSGYIAYVAWTSIPPIRVRPADACVASVPVASSSGVSRIS